MFLMLPCPQIRDKITLTSSNPNINILICNQARQILRQLSNTENLITRVQQGQTVIIHKIKLDQYCKAQVDLMKSCISSSIASQFQYNGFFTQNQINTTLMTLKEQWGFEILMSRYIICGIYHGGSIGSLGVLFNETTNSYRSGYKNTPELTKNLQITFKYFNQAFQPLKRLSTVMDSMEHLFEKSTLEKFPQVRQDMFQTFTDLIQCNLAYLKIEKYRLLSEYRSCKQSAWTVYQRMKDLKVKIMKLGSKFNNLSSEISDFINLGIVFYKTYSLYALLEENEQKKIQEEYGFIKKEFQDMIMENIVVADEIIKLSGLCKKLPNQELDNVMFASQLVAAMEEFAQRIKVKYDINLHENKSEKPSIDMICGRINPKDVWGNLSEF